MGQGLVMKVLTTVLVAALMATSVSGQVVNEHYKFTLDDPEVFDQFGASVAVTYDYIVVGSVHKRIQGLKVGAVYVYDAVSREELAVLSPPGDQEFIEFGSSVSVFGNRVVVGAWAYDGAFEESGVAYVYDAVSGQLLLTLEPFDPAAFHGFGYSVAISDSIILVGAYRDSQVTDASGAVYVFDAETGAQLRKVVADDAMANDQYGIDVDIDGNLAAIGSNYVDQDGIWNVGSLYVYDIQDWFLTSRCFVDDAQGSEQIGSDVDLCGQYVVTGSQTSDVVGVDSGAAFVFDALTGQQIHKLIPSDTAPLDAFGRAVALNNSVVVAGSILDDDLGFQSGSAYLFDLATGQQIMKLLASDGDRQDLLGDQVGLSETVVLVSSPTHSESGAVYLYSLPYLDCPADINYDGSLTPADFTAWVAAFNNGALGCDQNGDGACTPSDFTAWIANYNLGCG
ncbi:MAG: hypothetical protein Phyf2KO_21620 [Phycisphaerales bacterium]